MTKLHEIPTTENFLKGLEKIKLQQLKARETSKLGIYPFEGNEFSHYSTGVVTPKGKHYLVDSDGNLSFTGTKFLRYEGKEAFPPFSAAELLLDSKDDFKIDFAEAIKYYNLNKELAMKENENILSSKEFKPEHPITLTVNQEIKEVKNMLEEQGLDPSENPEVSALLDQHFSKLEKLLADFSEKVEKASLEDIPKIEENMKGKLNKIFTDLKDGLKQLFVDMKDKVQSGIENKVNDVKVNIHNAVAEKVQKVNDKIKDLTATLDKKYQIIEKEPEKLQKEPVGRLDQEDKHLVASVQSQVQKAFDVVKDVAKTEAAKVKAPEVSQSLADMSPHVEELENQNKHLKKENDGLKTFVNVVKSNHPEVFQGIKNMMKEAPQNELKTEQKEIKRKEVELQL